MYVLICVLTITMSTFQVSPSEVGEGCEDDVYRDCLARVEAGACTGHTGAGDPYWEARLALAQCRHSCQVLHSLSSQPLTDFTGGL